MFGIAALGLGWNKIRHTAPVKLADPADVGVVVPVPAQPVPPRAAQSKSTDAAALMLSPANSGLASPTAIGNAGNVAGGNKTQSSTTPDDLLTKVKSLMTTAEQVVQGQQEQAERDAKMQADLDSIKQEIAKLQARRSAANRSTPPQVRPQARQQPKPITASDDSPQLLSVDVWDGKPSVVVGRGRGHDADVRFLNEGETQGRVTVKKADVGSQRALLSTGKGEIVMSRDQD
jgi:hypothetical protein